MLKSPASRGVTIVVPVYGDLPSLLDCVESLKRNVSSSHKVIFANDIGPEADKIEREITQLIAGYDHFEYHRNEMNLGFLKNCNNAAFELDKTDNDIMLLNSDTIVTEGFVERLADVLREDEMIASVSPRSNNATITTIPISSMSQKGVEPEESYRLFLKMKEKLPFYNLSPVSHGFCMLIRRAVIKECGLFDEAFGKGYGEEVDFSMRVKQYGYKSAICNQAFVYHMEARSFGAEQKKALVNENEKIVVQRYPNYRKLVRDYRIWAEDQERKARYGAIIARTYSFLRRLRAIRP